MKNKILSILLTISLMFSSFISVPVYATEVVEEETVMEEVMDNANIPTIELDSVKDITVSAPAIVDKTVNSPRFDPRDYGLITPVKEQLYGDCWNYSMQATAEQSLMFSGLEDNTIDLSEGYFLYLTGKKWGLDGRMLYWANFGSHNSSYTRFPAEDREQGEIRFGLESVHPTPYPITDDYKVDLEKYVYKLDKAYYTMMRQTDESRALIKAMILNYGAVSGTMYYHRDYKEDYQNASDRNTTDRAYYCPEDIERNHAVTIVGWNDGYSKNNFKNSKNGSTPPANGAWLVKNSYGSAAEGLGYSYGTGYLWVSYYDPTIYDDEAYAFTLIPKDQPYNIVEEAVTIPVGGSVEMNHFYGKEPTEYSTNVYERIGVFSEERYDGINYLGCVTVNVYTTADHITMNDDISYTFSPDGLQLQKELGENTYRSKAIVNRPNIDEWYATDLTNGYATFTSSNEDIATVDDNGFVTYHDFGTATITATWCDEILTQGRTLTGSFNITIKESEECRSLTCNTNEINMQGKSYDLNQLNVVTEPANCEYYFETIGYGIHVDNNNILTIDPEMYAMDGVIPTVRIVAKNNPSITKTILVFYETASPVIPTPSFSLKVGESTSLGVTTEPYEDTLSYVSSNESVAIVNEEGMVTAKGVGYAQITVTTGSGQSGYINIYVSANTTTPTIPSGPTTPTQPTYPTTPTTPTTPSTEDDEVDTDVDVDEEPVDDTIETKEFDEVEVYEDKTACIKDVATNKTSVTIPKYITYNGVEYKVTEIGEKAFLNCKKLKSVTIPNTVERIGNKAFYNCTSLTKVTIPNSVTTIGSQAFYGCKKLKTIKLGSKVTEINEKAFYNCTSLTSITLPSKVEYIGAYAFQNCKKITKITIPSKVEYIGKGAFKGCSKLKTITIKTKKLGTDSKNCMSGLTKSKVTIKVPSSKKSAYKKMWKGYTVK